MNLLVNGQVVATATGNNSGALNWVALDLSRLRRASRRTSRSWTRTDASVGWGHLIVDDIGPLRHTAAAPGDTETGVNLLVDGKVVASATG